MLTFAKQIWYDRWSWRKLFKIWLGDWVVWCRREAAILVWGRDSWYVWRAPSYATTGYWSWTRPLPTLIRSKYFLVSYFTWKENIKITVVLFVYMNTLPPCQCYKTTQHFRRVKTPCVMNCLNLLIYILNLSSDITVNNTNKTNMLHK